jgi:hypothetical protein
MNYWLKVYPSGAYLKIEVRRMVITEDFVFPGSVDVKSGPTNRPDTKIVSPTLLAHYMSSTSEKYDAAELNWGASAMNLAPFDIRGSVLFTGFYDPSKGMHLPLEPDDATRIYIYSSLMREEYEKMKAQREEIGAGK